MADNEQVTLDNPDISLVDWKSARNKGENTVKLTPAVEEETEETPKETPKDDELKEEGKPKSKGGFQKKIDRLTKLHAEEARARELVERERDELKAKLGKTEEKPKADDEPKEEDFNGDVRAFFKAQARWEARQEIKAQEEARERAAQEAETREIFDNHNRTISEARAKYEDFEEVVKATDTPWKEGDKADVAASQAFSVAMFESGMGGELLYYLGKHPDELAKMEGLSPVRIQMAVGRIIDKLEAKSDEEDNEEAAPKAKKVTAEEEEEEEKPKKVPVKPISGTAKSDVALTEMLSLRDFKKARNAGRVR